MRTTILIIFAIMCFGTCVAQITLNIEGSTYTVTGSEMINSMNAFAMGVESCATTNSQVSAITLTLAPLITTNWDWTTNQYQCQYSSTNSADERWTIMVGGTCDSPSGVLYFNGVTVPGGGFNTSAFYGSGISAARAFAIYYTIQLQLNETLATTGYVINNFTRTTYSDGSQCAYYNQCDISYEAIHPTNHYTLKIIDRRRSANHDGWEIQVINHNGSIAVTYISNNVATSLSEAINYINR